MTIDWTAIAAIATALAAVVTGWMAWMTRNSIRQMQEHHRDAFRPLIILMPHDGVDPYDRKSLAAFIRENTPAEPSYVLRLRGALQNIGVGPALDIRLRIALTNPDDIKVSTELSPMRAGEVRHGFSNESTGIRRPLDIPVQLSKGFNDTDFQMAGNGPWTIFLEFEDVFGYKYRTTQSSSLDKPWTSTECWQGGHWVRA